MPIGPAAHLAELARRYRREGFSCFKVKVGHNWSAEVDALRAVADTVPDATFRIDANGGFSAVDALALIEAACGAGLTVECYEQPCAREALHAMSRVTANSPAPVVADESFHSDTDLTELVKARAAHGVNLKLAKLGGPVSAMALAARARAAGMRLMAGAMVETRVGLLAMAHVVAALGGVDWVDLDTAFLLAADPFTGGWTAAGPRLTLSHEPGLGVGLAD